MPAVLSDSAQVLAATGDDPLTRSTLVYAAHDVTGWVDGDAVVWQGCRDGRGPVVVGAGTPSEVGALLAGLDGELPRAADFSLPGGTTLPERVHADRRGEWELRWTRTPPPAVPGEQGTLDVDGDAVADLIGRAYPTAEARPGDAKVRGWVGVYDGPLLVAAAADTSGERTGRIAAVMTDPAARGRGLGAAVTVALTRRLQAEFGLVVLGLYLDNATARRLYERIGYTHSQLVTSGHWTTKEQHAHTQHR